jgi:hypothetical protein
MKSNLVAILKDYTKIRLEERFDWDFPLHGLPAAISTELSAGNPFERNISLKKCLHRHLPDETREIEYWIIQTWGRIRRFGRDSKNDARIEALYGQLHTGSLSSDLFGCISSLSKIASFFNPERYAIYDARATFSLNWLLLKSGVTRGFFPVPLGRNTDINRYDIETLVRLKCGDTRDTFFDRKYAYFEYIKLLSELSSQIWSDPERKIVPYYLEMLLFVIGPQEVVSDIGKLAKIEIRTTA